MIEETASGITRRLYAQLGYQPDEITERLLSELQVTGRARRVLTPWVRDRVQHLCSRIGRQEPPDLYRLQDHARQHQAGATMTRSQRVTAGQKEGDPRLWFLDSMVPCPGAPGGMRQYRHFTVDDHEFRMGMHAAHRNGAARRVRGHAWAVREIRMHQVTTLDEIPPEKLVTELPRGGVMP